MIFVFGMGQTISNAGGNATFNETFTLGVAPGQVSPHRDGVTCVNFTR